MIKFSSISQNLLGKPNALSLAVTEARAKGKEIIDLTAVTTGSEKLEFPQDILQSALSEGIRRSRIYHPDSFGQLEARRTIAEFYEKSDCRFEAGQILLTCGSSLSYLYLFKLLGDAGAEFLCPTPTYPLFDYLAKLADVKIASYPLRENATKPHWTLDPEELENRITTQTRAIILVSPHNPTGMVLNEKTLQNIAQIAARHHLAIIHDEVFSEFIFEDEKLPRAARTDAPLVFTLNGISKMFALPGMKLSWVAVSGQSVEVKNAMARLEMIADTFLPVNEIVQGALAQIMQGGKSFLTELKAWSKARLEQSLRLLEDCPAVTVLPPQGGFYLVLKLKNSLEAEEIAVSLVKQQGVLVHPGSFYDMPGNHLVFCFNHEESKLAEGLNRLRAFLGNRQF